MFSSAMDNHPQMLYNSVRKDGALPAKVSGLTAVR